MSGREGLRSRLRGPEDALPGACIGTVPILWNNVDQPELLPETGPLTVLDEIARTGFEGTQFGRGFPVGEELRAALTARGLRLAEVYAALPVTPDGPADAALAGGRERLRILHGAGGDVLCVAVDGSPERDRAAGRVTETSAPALTEAGWKRLAEVLERLAGEAASLGHRVAFHPHAGTFVETPDEVAELVAATDPGLVGVCLDVGHLLVGGGDPVEVLTALGPRVIHLHLKDVDPDPLARLRSGELGSLSAAIRDRIFTELGAGILDLTGILAVLAGRNYDGWLMVEQDSSWCPPSESAAIGRRVLAHALRELGRDSGRIPTRETTA